MATKTKRLRVLNEAYAELPQIECKGLCVTTCTLIPLEAIELINIERATGRVPATTPVGDYQMLMPVSSTDDRCPYLLMDRCSIYEQRPTICRLYGVARGLQCPHGCQPTQLYSEDAAQTLLRRIRKI